MGTNLWLLVMIWRVLENYLHAVHNDLSETGDCAASSPSYLWLQKMLCQYFCREINPYLARRFYLRAAINAHTLLIII